VEWGEKEKLCLLRTEMKLSFLDDNVVVAIYVSTSVLTHWQRHPISPMGRVEQTFIKDNFKRAVVRMGAT